MLVASAVKPDTKFYTVMIDSGFVNYNMISQESHSNVPLFTAYKYQHTLDLAMNPVQSVCLRR
jgi:hypothetical protein